MVIQLVIIMSQKLLSHLEPKIVWSIFEDITKVPRPSKKEEKIRKWIKNWAKENEIKTIKEDKVGNILLAIDASPECKKYPTLILQAHMDMVCQKELDVDIDFDNDPIEIILEDDIVKANRTSLGADNGIGMAFALAALIDEDLKHGPIEVLLTVDEETGLTGAFAVKPGFFSGNYLLNVDSEEIGKITISSAGGGGTDFDIPIKFEEKMNHISVKLIISGLLGGHSGVDIDLPRLNAIKIGIDALTSISDKIHFNSISAGSVHNAIPRDFTCEFLVEKESEKAIMTHLKHWKKNTLSIAKASEPNISIEIKKGKSIKAIDNKISQTILNLLLDIKHGPHTYSKEITGLVQTSSNLATVQTLKNKITIHVSTRSSVNEELEFTRNELKNIAKKYNVKVTLDEAYPGWKPTPDAPFVQMIKKSYEEVIGKPVGLEAIHGGLECGLFVALNPELQVSSIGANIKNAHSPDEYVEIASVKTLYDVIKKVIENMGAFS
ncbi:MAG: aminoacyl-histidine dipeptidase [Asgard group archaeon]|nr:aminoacyl-histidine dipeptidase [Asgard group archaeon]